MKTAIHAESLAIEQEQDKHNQLKFAADLTSSLSATMGTFKTGLEISPSNSNSSSLRSSTRANISLSKHSNPSLHNNLMRRRKHRNPHELFEVVDVLGVGSMGSVSKVKKKEAAIGGSARSDLVNKFHADQFAFCFSLPIVGSLLGICTGGRGEHKKNDLLVEKSESSPSSIGSNKSNNSRKKYFRKTSSIIIYGENEEIYYALKSIHMEYVRNEVYRQELKNEIELLKTLDHPNIVKAIETFEYHNHLYILLELCSGGDLYIRDPYTEEQAAAIINSICSAVAYMHSVGITHRDLKYENVVFANSTPDSEVKIIDFGLSKTYGKDDRLHDTCGTIYTMAPEVLRGDYTNEADVWSIGVLAFMLLSSSMPFYGKRRQNVMDKILKGEYTFKGRRWKRISPDAKDFVADLLQLNPQRRPTATEASQNAWLSSEFTDDGDAAEVAMMDAVQATLQNFAGYGTLKKLGLMVIAHKSTSQEIGFLNKIFGKYDKNKNGIINMPEFKAALAPYGYTDDEIETTFQGIDLDGTGVVHYTEFLAASIEAHGKINEERIAEAFDRLDCDDSGFITTKNLRDFLGESMPANYLDEIIDEADLVEDHRISYDEFLQLWSSDDDSQRQDSFHDVVARRMRHCPSSQMSAGQTSSSQSNVKSTSTLGSPMHDLSENNSDLGLSFDEDYWTGQAMYQSEKAKSMRAYDM